MREKNKPYPEQFRLQMVEFVKAGRKPRELAIEFGCHESSSTHWVRQYAGGMSSTVTPTSNKRQELIKLSRRVRVRQLEGERDILSKATAWLAGNGAQMSTASALVQANQADASKTLSLLRSACKAPRISKSGYYEWLGRASCQRAVAKAHRLRHCFSCLCRVLLLSHFGH